jgi:hypothetical protein
LSRTEFASAVRGTLWQGEPDDHAISRSRGGLPLKIHLACDGRWPSCSRPASATTASAHAHFLEQIRVPRLGRGWPRCRPDHVVEDTAYASKKESPDPDREAELDRLEEVLNRCPDRVFAFDEFGPLGIWPNAGSG